VQSGLLLKDIIVFKLQLAIYTETNHEQMLC